MKKIKVLFILLLSLLLFPSFSMAAPVNENGVMNISREMIKKSFDKNLGQYDTGSKKTISRLQYYGNLNNSDYTLTPFGQFMGLNILNFMREVSGLEPVTLNDTYTNYCQAGVDYLTENNLDIDHYAADNSDNTDAKTGLRGSNLDSSYNPAFAIMGLFSDFFNVSGKNTGHRDWFLTPGLQEVGIASAKNGTAVYVHGDQKNMKRPVVSYPAAGISPFELIDTEMVPLWSINFGDYYKYDLVKTKINITDNTGKSIDYNWGLNSRDNQFTEGGIEDNTINIDPYNLVDGNYKNTIGKTYTITVTGLEGVSDTLSYTTQIVPLNSVLLDSYVPISELKFKSPELNINVNQTVDLESLLEVVPENATDRDFKFVMSDSIAQIGSLGLNGKQKLTGLTPGTGTLTVSCSDGKKATCTVVVGNNYYQITTSTNPSNGGRVEGGKSYNPGDTAVLKAYPNDDYEFVNWTENDSIIGTTSELTISVTRSMTITANFKKTKPDVITYKISAFSWPLEGGKVTGVGTFENGTTQTLQAIPNSGYEFLCWKETGTNKEISKSATYTFTVTHDLNLAACFTNKNTSSNQDKPTSETDTTPNQDKPTSETGSAIYRLYNEISGEHLYTSDLNEYNTLPRMGWTQEGVGWNSPKSGTAVYRVYNPNLADHLYTTDENELRILTTERGWQADNNGQPLFYSGGSIPVYRLYHEGTFRHLLTRDENENNVLGNSGGWKQEGVGLKALS